MGKIGLSNLFSKKGNLIFLLHVLMGIKVCMLFIQIHAYQTPLIMCNREDKLNMNSFSNCLNVLFDLFFLPLVFRCFNLSNI